VRIQIPPLNTCDVHTLCRSAKLRRALGVLRPCYFNCDSLRAGSVRKASSILSSTLTLPMERDARAHGRMFPQVRSSTVTSTRSNASPLCGKRLKGRIRRRTLQLLSIYVRCALPVANIE
jgi:hypothetical protein